MKPTDVLFQEHRVIEQVLDCLEQMAQRCEVQGTLDAHDAENAVAFFREFADECHHGKEETHLFPAMEAKGFPRNGGPTGVMLYEHDQGRALVRGMKDAIEPAAQGDAAARARFVRFARDFIGLLRQHIHKEDHCLFTMANQAFSDEDQERLLAAFAQVESEHQARGTHDTFLQVADALADRYGVAKAWPASASGPSCGCGH